MYVIYTNADNLENWTLKSLGGRGGQGQSGGNGMDGRPGKDATPKLSQHDFKEKYTSMCHASGSDSSSDMRKVQRTWNEMVKRETCEINGSLKKFFRSGQTEDYNNLTISYWER